jgi:hypothetical protein
MLMKGKIIKKGKLDNKGMTLAELLVTFALLGIFMVVATMIIASAMNVYYQAKGTSYGMQISQMLHDKIAGELEGAIDEEITSEDLLDGESQAAKGAMLISGDRIEFMDATGSHVNIGLCQGEDGKTYMAVHYYEVSSADKKTVFYEAVDWMFDKASYMGYYVKDMKFSTAGAGYGANIIVVELTIASPKYGEYTTTEYVECYNLDDESEIVSGLQEQE